MDLLAIRADVERGERMPRSRFCLPVLVLLAAGCAAGTGGAGGPCKPTLTCASQAYECGAFVDSCGATQQCGSCAPGTTCNRADGGPGFCATSGPFPPAGNPDGACQQSLPAAALPEDTSSPTTVVGTGTAASCTYAELVAAVAKGGIITFDCGADPVTIPVTATLQLRTDRHTVIDGGNRVTLDGGHAVRILEWNSGNWQVNTNVLTLQHLVLVNGRASGTELVPAGQEAACSTGYADGQGGALLLRDGVLHAVDVTFASNQAALIGPDTGGGAVYLLGARPATISRCSFLHNRASNAGAIGSLFATDFIYDSLFDGNDATGTGANDVSAAQCPSTASHQIGSGGNGGAIYSDGVAMDVTICGTQVRNNHAGAFGAAVFFTSNDASRKGTLTIRDSLMFSNAAENPYWQWKPGISTNANTPEPVNSDIRP